MRLTPLEYAKGLFYLSGRILGVMPERQLVEQLLIRKDSIPGDDWHARPPVVYRFRRTKDEPEELTRAVKAKSIGGLCIWKQGLAEPSPNRVHSTAVLMLNAADADSYLPRFWLGESILRPPTPSRFGVEEEEVRDFGADDRPEGFEATSILRERRFRLRGRDQVMFRRSAASAVDRAIVALTFHSCDLPVLWETIAPVVRGELDRVRFVMSQKMRPLSPRP